MSRLQQLLWFIPLLILIEMPAANGMYDPHLGRFCSRDPIKYSSRALNIYEYVSAQATRAIDPSGKVKIFDVDDSPKCSFGEEPYVIGEVFGEPQYSSGEPAGGYWGIMVELSPSEKDDMLADDGGFLVFTVRSRIWKWDCPNTLIDQSDKTNWAATAIVVLDGDVKMHRTNDPELERQYLSIFDMNGVQLEGKCGSGKLRLYFNVTVEVLTRSQARQFLHINRFDGESPTGDEVGRWTETRPWRAGGDRTGIPRASATADILFNKCVTPAVCNAQGAGASGSIVRDRRHSYSPHDFPDPWRF